METFVVPRYLSFFGELALDMLIASESARIAHVGCRTGYPDRRILERVAGAYLVGIDASPDALELAKNKAAALGGARAEYCISSLFAFESQIGRYSHALTLHPRASAEERRNLFSEMAQLLYSGGQALVALPLRGSFQEMADLFREYALKHDDAALGHAVEESAGRWPTIESLSEELERAGLEDIDVEIRQTELAFDSGRGFIEDPITRLLVVPELKTTLEISDLCRPLEYVRDSVDKYWSEVKFALSLNVGCASARKP